MKHKTYDDARESAMRPDPAVPFAFIQWQGTDVCMDVHCVCGEGGHVDAEFTFSVKCGRCGRMYFCKPYIELIEYEEHKEGDLEPEVAE